jgi:tetratricopeptide (TPR) repeat protein
VDGYPALAGRSESSFGTETAYARYTAAELLYENGDLESALDSLGKALLSDPSDVYLACRMAVLLIEAGEYSRARRRINAVLKADPAYAPGWLALAKLHHARGDDSEAEAAALRAIRVAPDDVEASLWLAEIERRSGQARSAAELLTHAVEAEPYNAEVHLALGRVSLGLKRYAAARRHLTAFLGLRPDRTDVIAELAAAYEAAGDKKEAVNLLELALEKDPTNEPRRLKVIALLLDLGLPERAERHLLSLSALDENDRDGALFRARLFAEAALYYDARELLASQLEHRPADPEIALALAAVETVLGRLEVAAGLLDDILPLEWSPANAACRSAIEAAIAAWPRPLPLCGIDPGEAVPEERHR